MWRPRPELNWCTRFCRPLRNHSATWPHETDLLQTIKGLGNLLRRVRRQFLKSGFSAGMAPPPRRHCQQSSLSPGRQGQPGTGQSIGHDDFPEKARQPCRTFLRSWSTRPRPPSVKVIVHVDASDIFPAGPSVSDLESSYRSNISDRSVTAEVKVKVLELGRPIACEHPFSAGAGRPAHFGLADACGHAAGYARTSAARAYRSSWSTPWQIRAKIEARGLHKRAFFIHGSPRYRWLEIQR
jgi:hypothetical protein